MGNFSMNSKLKTYAIIGGVIAAAAIIIGVVAITGVFDNKMGTPVQMTDMQNSQLYR